MRGTDSFKTMNNLLRHITPRTETNGGRCRVNRSSDSLVRRAQSARAGTPTGRRVFASVMSTRGWWRDEAARLAGPSRSSKPRRVMKRRRHRRVRVRLRCIITDETERTRDGVRTRGVKASHRRRVGTRRAVRRLMTPPPPTARRGCVLKSKRSPMVGK